MNISRRAYQEEDDKEQRLEVEKRRLQMSAGRHSLRNIELIIP